MEELTTPPKKERAFPTLNLTDQMILDEAQQPVLIVQSPKTPTLSKKLKAVSLDSDPTSESSNLEVSRDVFSMPNTPKKQLKPKLSYDFDSPQKSTLAPSFNSNLKKFASNNSISGSQTLKTLPEVIPLHDFSDGPVVAPIKFKAKGLLERRGSNASLTIDLGSNSSISEVKPVVLNRLNTAKSVSNLNLSTFDSEKSCSCMIMKKCEDKTKAAIERRKSQETCGNCTIYESLPNNTKSCKAKCQILKKCNCCTKSRRKSLSNENLYIPPCGFCQTGAFKDCSGTSKQCKGIRKACYPRQPDIETTQLLSEDFKLHLENIQYLQTAGNVLSFEDLRRACESRVPKLHQEFWEVPLNLQEKCYVSGSQSRNRYKGVLPNEHSRVHLSGSQQYIHANYIKGPDYTETVYIATQGPMAHTCQDFWEMVWSTHCKCIVMLTGLVEKGRSKCELYFPLGRKDYSAEKSFYYVKTTKVRDKFTFDLKANTQQYEEETHTFEEVNEVTFGCYRITYVSESTLDECCVRQLKLKKTDSAAEPRTIYHYWFSNWPDHKMANPEQVLRIALDVLNNMFSNKRPDNNVYDISKKIDESLSQSTKFNADLKEKSCCGKSDHKMSKKETMLALSKATPEARRKSMENLKLPVIVHCSAGIGRTGCFLAILNGIQQLRASKNVDVLAIVCSLRLNRGGMVQTAEQYELIHHVLSLYAKSMT